MQELLDRAEWFCFLSGYWKGERVRIYANRDGGILENTTGSYFAIENGNIPSYFELDLYLSPYMR